MLERYVTEALITQFGHLIQGFDADKVRLSAWKGELTFSDLTLRPDAIKQAAGVKLPFRIAHGSVGTLKVRIPWKLLVKDQLFWGNNGQGSSSKTQSDVPNDDDLRCSVVLTDVNILVMPSNVRQASSEDAANNCEEQEEEFSPVAHEQAIQSRIDAYLVRRVAQVTSKRKQWIQKLGKMLLANLTVSVRNIHLRYEDPGRGFGDFKSQYREPFALGVTLQEFRVSSQNPGDESENEPNYQTVSVRRRRAAAQDLAAYWDSNARIATNHWSPADYQQFFDDMHGHDMGSRHAYVLDAFSPVVLIDLVGPNSSNEEAMGGAVSPRAQQVADEIDATTRPPSSIRFLLPPCRFAISRSLLEDLGYLRNAMKVWKHTKFLSDADARRLALLRPVESATVNPRGWWLYASQAVLALARIEEERSTHSRVKGWLGMARAIRNRKLYLNEYRRVLLSNETQERTLANSRLLSLEEELSVDEVVAFRLFSCRIIREELLTTEAGRSTLKVDKESKGVLQGAASAYSVLSVEIRQQMFDEMAVLLDQEQLPETAATDATSPSHAKYRMVQPGNVMPFLILYISCPELSLQVNDRQQFNNMPLPVVILSVAFMQEQKLYSDKSWELTCRLGSLRVEDCMHKAASGVVLFPNLLGPKGIKLSSSTDETFSLADTIHHQSLHVQVERVVSEVGGSRTSVRIRVLPLEIVYSTLPVEALTRILNVASADFSDDYQGMANRVSEWRRRQQRRIVEALAHKEKSITIDLDMGAPVLLVPEADSLDSPLLVVDLGRLAFQNVDLDGTDFDDKWRLELADIQVQCTTSRVYRDNFLETATFGKVQQMIEPFSIDFAILTRIKIDSQGPTDDEETTLQITATLPRLIINATTSAVRLVKRLQNKWMARKYELQWRQDANLASGEQTQLLVPSRFNETLETEAMPSKGVRRCFKVVLFAPLLKLRLENDVDGRDCDESGCGTTQLIDLSLRGIEGRAVREQNVTGLPYTSWTAKLRALDALDQYQQAGDDYAYLLSSVSPDLFPVPRGHDESSYNQFHSKDLLLFEFASEASSETVTGEQPRQEGGSRLNVTFHELYIEWNPETLAALQHAISLSRLAEVSIDGNPLLLYASSDDEFEDAEEDEFFDAKSHDSANELSDSLPSFNSRQAITKLSDLTTAPPYCPSYVENFAVSQEGDSDLSRQAPVQAYMYRSKHLNVFFHLSKLRMRFNKEARHRRLFIAEMDSTTVTYSTTSANGWSSHVSVGNLAFADADSLRDLTLYREILGLKSDSGQSSLLRLDILKYPRSRRYVSQGDDPNVASLGCGVVIDTKQKKLHGCDISLEAHFSPMRFVFLEQLWFEIIDYFFEGIMGAEVWGTKKVIAEPSAALDAPNADLFSFTKFNIVMESPLIVFPVSYCSPDYLRVEASSIVFANSYSCSEMRIRDFSSNHSSCRWQWFNNCKIMLSSIRLVSSSGIDLLRFGDAFAGEVSLNWPSGPTAALNCPKWKVACAIDAVHMALDQDEFVLLQHIVQFNICEESRHLDEWRALQHLPLELREQYKASIMVHFGYDKKDVTPTTYELNVDVPSLSFGFRQGVAIADVRCEDISWTMWKAMDLVNRQRVECNVEILSVEKEGRVPLLMSSSLDRSPCPTATKDLVYESESDPFAENSKCLTIAYSRIYLIYSSWSRFSGFFKGLSGPKSVAPGEVIQIGDRWYNIKATDEESSARVDRDQLSWISAFKASSASAMEDSKANKTISSTFRLSLIQPSILVGTEEYGLVLKADKVNFYHNARLPQIERRFDLSGLQLQTQSSMVPSLDTTGSLIEPWHSHGIWRSCNCTVACACDSHIAQVEAGTLEARASFTDMTVAIEVLLRFVVDMRQTEHRHYKSGHELHIDTSSENAAPISFGPPKQSHTANWKGFKLVIIDDSGRHFATSQELAAFSLSEVAFQRTALLSLEHGVLYIMRLTLGSVDVADCLQSVTSPFRNVLAIRRIDDNVKLSSSEDKEYVGHAAVEVSRQLGACRDYHVKVSACELQYNPSLVIALQRFIGRLHKDFKFRVDAILTNHAEASFMFQRSSDPDAVAGKDVHINGTIEAETLILRLNKEHQGRQLIVTTVKDMTVRSSKSRSGMCIKGHLGSIYTVENDKIDDFGQTLLRATGSQKFLQFSFRKFATRRLAAFPGSDEKLPDWVIGRLLDEPELDDCLEVNISALELTFLRDRAEELIDYMTNGMPGRGMGATGRAAQHFVKERIQKKSFLQISLEAPTILIPVGYATASGLSCRLGDFTIKSWIDSRSLARKLAVVVCGLSLMRYKTVPNTDQTTIKSTIVSEIDFAVELEKSRVLLLSQIKISEVHVPLRYTDYVLLMAVFEGNVGRKTDKLAWNNLEAAWDKLASQGQAGGGEQEAFSNDLVYSSSARLIRYGKHEDEAAHKLKPIEVNIQVQCDRLSLVLHRDDCSVTLIDSVTTGQDVVLFIISRLRVVYQKRDIIESVAASLHRVHMFDVRERSIRHGSDANNLCPMPSEGTVMAEGYSIQTSTDDADNQIDVTIDRSPSRMDVSLVVNYLSLTALVKPCEEMSEFFSCSWGAPDHAYCKRKDVREFGQFSDDDHVKAVAVDVKVTGVPRCFGIKLVFHYPRFIFIADESDRHSRALVLEGLATANATISTTFESKIGTNRTSRVQVLEVQGDFQKLTSHIYPDISDMISVRSTHHSLLSILTRPMQELSTRPKTSDFCSAQRVPLLLPLTIGLEYKQKVYEYFPRVRSLCLSIDSLSMMLNTQDISLIHSLLHKWPAKQDKKSAKQSKLYGFEVSFEGVKLGLGLSKNGNAIVVDHVEPVAAEKSIEKGDIVHAINDTVLSDIESVALSDIVDHLASLSRPLTVSFSRHLALPSLRLDAQLDYDASEVFYGSTDQIDLTLSTGSLTFLEDDVTLLRANLRQTEISLQRNMTCGTMYSVKVQSSISLDCYNLRAWTWEPFLEPGIFSITATYQDPRQGSRELSIELGDRNGPICMNLSDAGIESIGKLCWSNMRSDAVDSRSGLRDYSDEAVHRIEAEERIAVHKAANAALQFALRQKYETAKPFVIRNRSGVPVAFALQQNLHNSVADQTLAYINPGDYPGMDAFSKGDVRFLGCDEEIKFFVDVASKDSNTSGRRFPSLTISLQATEEFAVEPVRDLDIGLAEETLVPLFEILASSQNSTSVHQWASWSVEQTLEKTILTFGGSIQLISLIRETIEVGISVHKSLNGSARDEIIAIGKCSAGRPLSLPLWLGLRKCAWSCVCKFDKDPAFTCLFKSSENLRRLNGTYVRFASDASDNKLSRSVSLSVYEVNDAYTISIDCGISFRNLLPTNIEWKIASGLPPEAKMIDNSSLRSFDSIGDQFLPSGERAEIFCNGYDGLYTQIRIYERQSWSTWVSLSLSNNAEPMPQRDSSTEVREANITDALGFSLNVGVRITRKGGGIDVAIFAEVWCSNFTSLPVVFGCPQHEIISAQYSPEELQPTELTAAEAALREISLLFEGGGSETGPPGKNAGMDADVVDIHRIPEQGSPEIVEECFEYNEMEGSRIKRNWWAGENPNAPRKALPYVDSCEDVRWLDESWKVDLSSGVDHGWESSPSLPNFSRLRKYDAQHRFRRRRWYRKRSGCVAVPEGITAFCQPMRRGLVALDGSGRENGGAFKMAVQVEGGRWALTPLIPSRGAAHGVIRVAKARWPYRLLREDTGEPSQEKIVYELCYSIAPLDDEWGDLSRLMVLTSRFLVRNDSISVVFEMKQAGSSDSSAITIKPGDTVAFHWSDRRLPMLVSVRPVDSVSHAFGWSGGFDPLMIGAVPLRTCRAVLQMDNLKASEEVMSIKVESEIRAKTGGTGISLALKEEDREGHGALFRIENATSFPIWFSQDGLLANGEDASGHASSLGGELIRSSASAVFALDVPFRQGKYAGRKAASMEELVRARVALAPLNSRAGIETTKVVSMIAVGEKVRLNPSRLMLLSSEIRASIRRIRVVGIVLNDGPTRVLRFGLMVKPDSDTIFSYPFVNEMFISISCQGDTQTAVYSREMEDGAYFANELLKDKSLLGEDDAILKMILDPVTISTSHRNSIELADTIPFNQEMIVSLRAAFRGLIVSLVDSAPSEICVISLENINAIATFDWLRTSGSTMYITVTSLQVDNMVPNAPFPVAIAPLDLLNREASARLPLGCGDTILPTAPLLVIGVSIAPKHSTGVVCFKSITIAPRNLSIHVDLAFLVRLQRYFVEIVSHFREFDVTEDWNRWTLPDIAQKAKELEANVSSAVGRQKFYFEGLTILPCQIKLSVAPARALTHAQALLEGEKAAQIHQAVRKGDVQLGHAGLLGVKVGHRNATPLAVVRGVFKSIVVDALLRLDGANLDFAGVSLRNHTSTSSQLITYIGAHYLASLRQNLPALLGSLAAFGNPLGLVRGLGDGVSDFVLEPMKGFQKSVQQMDATYLVDGVARGTLSLARHTVGGIADSAAMLTETFSKNMTILTLDRRYAQKRDRKEILREQGGANVGIGSGVTKLAQGFVDGVTGVVKAPMRGAEKKGIEGFAKGMGKGLLGLLVKPIIGISDGITDVMIGVKGTVDGGTGPISMQLAQIRPRRAFYGAEHVMRVYNVADAAAAALMMRTRLAGERYLNHLDMVDRVALLSVKRLLLLGSTGEELLVLKYKHIDSMEVRSVEQADKSSGWCIIVVLNTPRRNGSDIEVINCRNQAQANELRTAIEQGIGHDENRVSSQQSTALAIAP